MRKIFLIMIIVCSFSLNSLIELSTNSNQVVSNFSGISMEEHLTIYYNPAAVNLLEFNRASANLRFYNKGVLSSSLVSRKIGDLNICVYGEKSEIKKWRTTPYPWNKYYNYYENFNNEVYYDNGTSSVDDDYQITRVSDGIYYNTLNQFGDDLNFRIAIGKNNHGFLYKYNKSNSNNIPNGIQYEFQSIDIIEMGNSSPMESYHRLSESINENLTELTTHTFSWGIMHDLNANKSFDFALSVFHSSLSESSISVEYEEIDFDPDNDGNIVNNSYGWDEYRLCKNYRLQSYEEFEYKGDGIGFGVFSRITKKKTEKHKFWFEGKYFFQSLNTIKFDYFQTRIREVACFREEFYEVYSNEETFFVNQTDIFGQKIVYKFIDAYVSVNIEYHPIEKLKISSALSVDVVLNKKIFHLYTIDEDLDINPYADIDQTAKTELSIPIGVEWDINEKFKLKGIMSSNVYLGTFNSKYNYRNKTTGIANIFLNCGFSYNLSDKILLECARLKETGFSNPIYSFSFSYSY
ncbi:MAG: hypothetical protein KAS53_09640 [Candidatus Cloacimonetes bacterium]|nr:hypothetical protein [Candidatus Cloacimonadota bacterium]